MLETAKRELESRGIAVLGGYICPDHDRYVSSKIKVGSLSAAERLELCEIAVEDSDWLMVDRWAAMYAWSAVSFTTIISHIEKMVNHHVKTPRPIQVVYAFGGDNAVFASCFVTRWSCVCVLRPGSLEDFRRMAEYDSLRKNPRIIFSSDTTAPLDSTSVRKGDLSALLPKVKDRWLSMTTGSFPKVPSTRIYYQRNEGLWALQPCLDRPKCPIERLKIAYDTFCEELQNLFELAFDAMRGPVLPYKIIPARLGDQRNALRELLAAHGNIISLDPCLPATHNLSVLELAEPLVTNLSNIVAIPGRLPLEQQLEQVSAGAYAVFTENVPLDVSIKQLLEKGLPEGAVITTYLSNEDLISKGADHVPSTRIQGTINARDFLAGSHEGGTLLRLDDAEVGRAPNILPYIRAPVESTAEMGFSRAVWELNQQFFNEVGGELLVQDMAPDFQVLCEVQGFPKDMHMAEVCDWHLAAFESMQFKELVISL
jgi:nicotinic acid mononucleotide adenylyltransferase